MIRKISFSIFILTVVLVIMAADNQQDGVASFPQRLTNTADITQYPVVAAEGAYCHIACVDGDKLLYRRSTNHGRPGSWEAPVNMMPSKVYQHMGRLIGICAEGSYVYIVIAYQDTAANYEIWLRRSSNNGDSWNTWQRLTTNSGTSLNPQVACSGQYVYVLWLDNNPGNLEVFFKRSTDYGASFGNPIRLSYSAGYSNYPTICAAGAYVYVAWQDDNPGNDEIFFKGSGTHGASFGPIWRVTYTSGASCTPWLSCDSTGQYLYLAWADYNPGNPEIFFKRNTIYGTSGGWSGPRRMTYTAGYSFCPHIDNSADGSHVDVVWEDDNPGNYEIISKSSSDGGVNFGPAYRWTYNSGKSQNPQIDSIGWSLLWQDDNPGNDEIFFKK